MNSELYNSVMMFLSGLFFGSMAVMAFVFKGYDPQGPVDVWSITHFLFGLFLGYLSFYVFNTFERLTHFGLTPKLVVAMIPQFLWKVYEYVAGYSVFMLSLNNIAVDLVLGFVGATVGVIIIPKFVFRGELHD